MRFNEHFIKQALPDVSIVYGTVPTDFCFSIDSRTIKPGDIFVALHGKCYDGHDFVGQALNQGASGLMISVHKKSILD